MKRSFLAATALAAALSAPAAMAIPVTLTKLSGVSGDNPAATAVFRADLSSIGGIIQSISIADNSLGLPGSAGQFSGFDLDAIKISQTFCTSATCASGASGLSLFDFLAGTFFTAGTQATPIEPKLFGTGASGTTVNNAVATLGAFDGDSDTVNPDGFLSLGFGGSIGFNLTSALDLSMGSYYLYFGEVGDNGEAAAGSITVSSTPIGVPEPGMLGLLALGLLGARAVSRRKG
jgi:MYXO-CTERM domain-containing protein